LVDVEDAPKVEISKDQPEQAFTKDPPELVATNDRAEQQEFTEDQPKDEEVPEDTPSPPPKEGISSNKLVSPSPPPAQPPLPSPPSLSPTRVEEVPEIYLPPDDYWDDGYDYWGY
jgi:hypothetical protein